MQFNNTNVTFTYTAPTGAGTSTSVTGLLFNAAAGRVNAGLAPNIINAIQIDWCSAQLPNANPTTGGTYTISNSGQLLDLINEMQKEIYTLTAAVIALSNK
jgi:hypothetical protein